MYNSSQDNQGCLVHPIWTIIGTIATVLALFFAIFVWYVPNNESIKTVTNRDGTTTKVDSTPASPQTIAVKQTVTSENITIPCISTTITLTCDTIGITVQLDNVVIDTSGKMIWNFTLVNKLTEPVTIVARYSNGISIYLQDSTGTSIEEDGGTLLDDSNLSGGQSLPATATFQFVPKSDTPYFLHMDLQISRSAGFTMATYQTTSFTF